MTIKEARSIRLKQLSNEFPAIFPRPEFQAFDPVPYEGLTGSCGSDGRSATPHTSHVEPVARRKGFVLFLTGSDRRRRGGVRS